MLFSRYEQRPMAIGAQRTSFLRVRLLEVGVAPALAFLVRHVPVACRCSGELGSTSRTERFRRGARLLSLVTEEVAEGGKLPAIAPVVPTPRFWTSANNSNLLVQSRGL